MKLDVDTRDERVLEHRCWLIMKAVIPGNVRAAVDKIYGWNWTIDEAAEYLGGKSWFGKQVAIRGLRYWERHKDDSNRRT